MTSIPIFKVFLGTCIIWCTVITPVKAICNSPVYLVSGAKVTHLADEPTTETFNAFFKKFNSSSVFQYSRIQFPLTTITVDEGSKTTKSVSKKEWKYTNLYLIRNVIIKMHQINAGKAKVELMIEDTGVNVNYWFEKQNNKWMLVQIVDESD